MIVGLLSWYQERPGFLTEAVESLALVADRVVAVDGAYALFPNGRAYSDPKNAQAIRAAAAKAGLECCIFQPRTVWAGNEVEKRAFMFALAEKHTTAGDWYFVLDSDERVVHAGNIRPVLEATDLDVGSVHMCEPDGRALPIRKFFRAVRGLTVRDNHYSYQTPDGVFLWGGGRSLVFAEELDVLVEHRKRDRVPARARAAVDYYRRRDRLAVETQ